MFIHNGIWHLYNAQSNFLSKVSSDLIRILKDGNWDELDEETSRFMLERHIIELQGHRHDHFDLQQMKFHSRNFDPTSLGLVIAPTTACNFNCPYCFEPKLSPKTISTEKIADLMRFIRMHPNARSISLTWYGGEPLLAFGRIKEIYEAMKMDGIPAIVSTMIVTNGSLLNEEICDFFREKKLDTMQITIDGNEESHNRTRCYKADGAPSFDTIYRNVRLVREKIPDCRLLIRVNVNKNNLADFVDLYKKVKADFGDDPMISVYPGFIREETPDGRSMAPQCIISRDLLDVYTLLREQGVDQSLFPKRKNRGCMLFSQNSYIIGPEGEIYKCWNDVTKPDRVIGNISDTSRFNSRLLTRYMLGATPFREECRDCKVFPICDAGCGYYQYKNLYDNGNFDHCSALKDDRNLEKALIEGSLSKITEMERDDQ